MSRQSFAQHFSTFEQGKKLSRFGICQNTPHYCFRRGDKILVLAKEDAYMIAGESCVVSKLKKEGKDKGVVGIQGSDIMDLGEKFFDSLLEDTNNDIACSAYDLCELGVMLPDQQISSDRLPGWFLDKWGKSFSGATVKIFLNAELVCDYLIAHIEKGYTTPAEINHRLEKFEDQK